MALGTCALLLLAAGSLTAQQSPAQFTAEQDRQNMMAQLGIRQLRPGRNADPQASNPANYDEARANPYPDLPDPLQLRNGRKVTTPALWWSQRRPEIVEDFEREVYGRVPANVPKVTWETLVNEREFVGFTPVIAKRLVGRVDNSSYPQIEVEIDMVVVTPANARGPVPLLMMFGPARLPAPQQPSQADLDRINAALKQLLVQVDSSLRAVFERYKAYEPLVRATPAFPATAAGADPPTTQQLLAAGWGYAYIDPASIQADNGAGLTRGIIGLVNQGRPRKPDDWGALRAWAWGAARGLDYLATDSAVDAQRVGIEGVSRYGKAALVALAFEPRFAMGLIGSSGKGGATLHRRSFGEAVENLTGGGGYHWMAGNYLKYGAAESKSGSGNAGQLPVDSHQLIALAAPRLVFISYGVPERGDARWLDHQGSYMAAVAAGPVFKLLGARDLGVTHDYRTAKMPSVNVGLLDGHLAWRQHDGGHTDAPNVKHFIEWANRMLTPASTRGNSGRD
jgi:hypothetical protein